jgi:DNA-binding response OmpR family regulator
VLIAEDDTPIAAIVCAAIEDAGYHAVVARDGRQALELARSVGPSLVITDMMMPFLTGADLIRALREDAAAEQRSPVPTILMTAVSALSARSAGADALLRKPFDLDELDNLVNIYLTGGA